MLRKIWIIVFMVLTGGALAQEFWAGLDSSTTTVPWTDLISTYIPQPITMTVLALLASWLPVHFAHHYTGAAGASAATPPQSRYLKAAVPMVVAGLTALQAALSDDKVTRPELIEIAMTILGASGVYAISNAKPTPPAVTYLRQTWDLQRDPAAGGERTSEPPSPPSKP